MQLKDLCHESLKPLPMKLLKTLASQEKTLGMMHVEFTAPHFTATNLLRCSDFPPLKLIIIIIAVVVIIHIEYSFRCFAGK